MMVSSLLGPLLLLFLSNSVRMHSVLVKHYIYVIQHYTWEEAQSYCRGLGHDLAFIHAQSDFYLINRNLYNAWIGYYKNTEDDWVWTNGDDNSINWCREEPGNSDMCAYAYSADKHAYGTTCESSFYFFFCQSDGQDDHIFIPVSKMWADAREYCRRFHKDLSHFTESTLAGTFIEQDYPVWTGLHRNGTAWNWSRGVSNFTIWGEGQPNNTGDCVSMSSLDNQMATHNCTDRFPSVCFNDNLVVVTENKTWEEALEHCRSLEVLDVKGSRYDLVSVQPGEDHTYFKFNMEEEALTDMVWTGLRFLAGHWMWINGVQQLPPGLPLCPPMDQHCATLSGSALDVVEIRDCSEKWNFMCYRKW